jgi:hypothetical protein
MVACGYVLFDLLPASPKYLHTQHLTMISLDQVPQTLESECAHGDVHAIRAAPTIVQSILSLDNTIEDPQGEPDAVWDGIPVYMYDYDPDAANLEFLDDNQQNLGSYHVKPSPSVEITSYFDHVWIPDYMQSLFMFPEILLYKTKDDVFAEDVLRDAFSYAAGIRQIVCHPSDLDQFKDTFGHVIDYSSNTLWNATTHTSDEVERGDIHLIGSPGNGAAAIIITKQKDNSHAE